MRRIVYLAVALIVTIVLWLLWHSLSTGRLIVTTNVTNGTINLSSLTAGDNERPLSSTEKQSLSARLSPGKYVVEVVSKSFVVSRVVDIKARQTSRYSLNPSKHLDLEPVYGAGAESIVADGSSLLYIDPGSGILYSVNAQNSTQIVDASHNFGRIKWAGTSYGVGLVESGQFYTITPGSITALSMPFDTSDNQAVDFDVTSSKQIFVSHGEDVYASTAAGNFKKIYRTKSPSPALAATDNKVAIIEAPGDIINKGVPAELTVLSQSGRLLTRTALEAKSAAWSPDGKYLALLGEGSELGIVDASLHTITSFPAGTISSMAWVGDSLYYTTAGQLWSYSVVQKTAQVIDSLAGDSALSDAVASSDGSYIYLSAVYSGGNAQIVRYGLHGQKSPYYVYQLPIFLPDSSQGCALNYINFTQPTITGSSDSDPQQTCASALQTVFAPYGIDITQLHTNFTQNTTQ